MLNVLVKLPLEVCCMYGLFFYLTNIVCCHYQPLLTAHMWTGL